VGVPAPGVEVRISEDGEVFYRGAGTFEYYYKNEESTKKTKDAQGWVATGDAGFFEEGSGHLRIIDRAKDVGKMADGSLFAPKYVENKLKFFPNIYMAVVHGDGRDTCTAFINIDIDAVGSWAERNNVSYSSYQELAANDRVYDMVQGHIEEVNASVADDPMLSGCQIHRFLILHKQLDADDGEPVAGMYVRAGVVESSGPAVLAMVPEDAPRAESAADGSFRIVGVPPGEYRVVAHTGRSEYVAQRSRDAARVTLEAGRIVTDVELAVRRGGTILGEVRGPGGDPVEHAELNAIPSDMMTDAMSGDVERMRQLEEREIRSDEDGEFEIAGLDLDRKYHVAVEHDDFARALTAAVELTAAGPVAAVEIELERGVIPGQS